MIPEKKDTAAARAHRGSAGGRPRALDTETYKGRNVVERSFALIKQWRGLATRYDKLAITYRAAIVLAACLTWTRIEETRPRSCPPLCGEDRVAAAGDRPDVRAVLVAETGEITRFARPEQLSSRAGLMPKSTVVGMVREQDGE